MQTGFLSAFSNLNPTSQRAFSGSGGREEKAAAVKLSHLWIKLLVNLSFSTDGQQMIIKQPGDMCLQCDSMREWLLSDFGTRMVTGLISWEFMFGRLHCVC